MGDIEEHLKITIEQTTPKMEIPVDQFDGKVIVPMCLTVSVAPSASARIKTKASKDFGFKCDRCAVAQKKHHYEAVFYHYFAVGESVPRDN